MFNELIKKIHYGVNPYDNFSFKAEDLDTQGWGSEHPWFKVLVEKHKPKVVIEVGSWKGGSARHIASCLKYNNLNAAVVCVDTWLAEEILWTVEEWRSSLKFKNGRPNVYQTFMANTVAAGLQNYIIPLSMPSLAGARYLTIKNVVADFVYIDGSHVEGDVYRDLEAYWELLKPGGSLIADDYLPNNPHNPGCDFRGLVRDIDKFAAEKGLKLQVSYEKCLLEKP